MKNWCPHSAYRLLAAKVVLVSVAGFGYLASAHVQTMDFHAETPAYCLAADTLPAHPEAALQPGRRDREMFSIDVTVTGYSSTPGQTDSTPFITASNTKVREGIIAVSRDLLMRYTPGAPFHYGELVEIEGIGTFRVEDTMNRRYTKRVDIWFPDPHAARTWGVQKASLVKLLEDRRIPEAAPRTTPLAEAE